MAKKKVKPVLPQGVVILKFRGANVKFTAIGPEAEDPCYENLTANNLYIQHVGGELIACGYVNKSTGGRTYGYRMSDETFSVY